MRPKPMTVQQMARLGGLAGGRSRSKAKLAAARRNIRKAMAARHKPKKVKKDGAK